MRKIAHFSCGAASAVATKLSNPDEIWYAKTGGEDADNERFLLDCQEWFGQPITILQSTKYDSTWELWEARRYLSGPRGAPCTQVLKVKPLHEHAQPGDINIIGYTSEEARRVKQIQAIAPEQLFEFPLIERGIDKVACLGALEQAGIKPPRVYALGFHNANCIPCVKATSPAYWALMRKQFPEEFWRMDRLARELGCRPVQFSNRLNKETGKWEKERGFPSDVPENTATQDPISPACDLLCSAMTAEFEI